MLPENTLIGTKSAVSLVIGSNQMLEHNGINRCKNSKFCLFYVLLLPFFPLAKIIRIELQYIISS